MNNTNLHIHTTYSDGGNTPAEIITMLKEAGVTVFSITDHDTVEGNVEAIVLAKEYDLTHINGIELSCCFADGELGLDESWVIHILGYGFNMDLMREKLAEIDVKKHRLLRELFDLLVADGYNIELENVAHDGMIAERTCISKELIRKGYAADGNECFSKILNTERYRQFAKYKPSIKDGIEIIHACGGLAVWAHPFGVTRGGKKELSQEQVEDLLFVMLDYSVDGTEVYYQQYSPEKIFWLNNKAESYRLYKTVGTDYHNPSIDLNKHPEYAEVLKREKVAFDVVKTDAGVETTICKISNPNTDEAYYPHLNRKNMKNYRFKCERCDWEGLGSETYEENDRTWDRYCPKCKNKIAYMYWPTNEDLLRFGTSEDRALAKKWIAEETQRKSEDGEQ